MAWEHGGTIRQIHRPSSGDERGRAASSVKHGRFVDYTSNLLVAVLIWIVIKFFYY